jgi:hypothetical protein
MVQVHEEEIQVNVRIPLRQKEAILKLNKGLPHPGYMRVPVVEGLDMWLGTKAEELTAMESPITTKTYIEDLIERGLKRKEKMRK